MLYDFLIFSTLDYTSIFFVMRIKFKLLILLSILAPLSVSIPQEMDLMQLEAIRGMNLGGDDAGKIDEPVENEDLQRILKERKSREILEKEVQDFGYDGRGDFLAKPNVIERNKPLNYFGYDYFIENSDAFLAITDTPIPPDYIIGPGDEVKAILFGIKNKRISLEVSRDGEIFFPEIGPVSVSGLTFKELKSILTSLVNNQMVGTQISITLGNIGSKNIFVLGEAAQPGMYTVSSLSTLTNAIFFSGGINTSGSLRDIQVKRKGEVISSFDFYDLLLKGDITNDVRLMPNDVVFIPPISKTVAIKGQVARPGIYELKPKENLDDLIRFAGTLKPKADPRKIEFQRVDLDNGSFSLKSVNIEKSIPSELNLIKGDMVTVYPIMDRMRNVILLSGHTQQPGFMSWSPNLKLKNVIKSREMLLPMTDMSYMLIKRQDNKNQGHQIIQVSLEDMLTESNTSEDITLKEMDELIFFPRLLTTDLIDTKLLDAVYDEESEYQGLTYVRKSLEENLDPIIPKEELVEVETLGEEKILQDDLDKKKQLKKYFKYTIHDYCVLSDMFMEELIEAVDEEESTEQILTNYCRRQLIDPIMALLNKQGNPENKDQVFNILGDVYFPGEYPLSIKQTLDSTIKAAGGLMGSAFVDEVEITSSVFDGKKVLSTINIVSMANSKKIIINPIDTINVKQALEKKRFATIEGEVYFPGKYPIVDNETISSLIERAGGLKPNGSTKDSFFQRESLKDIEIKRIKDLQQESKTSYLLASSTGSGLGKDDEKIDIKLLDELFNLDLEDEANTELLGRMIINLDSILNKQTKDIQLLDGDRLTIPKQRDTITVYGEVYAGNTHQFDSLKSIEEYIDMSGGVTAFADKKRTYIIKSNGSYVPLSQIGGGFFRNGPNTLEKGDSIVVPIQVDQFSTIQATTEITKIIYEMAVAAAAISSFGN
jgi:polysaccharide biosynthesis/export protein